MALQNGHRFAVQMTEVFAHGLYAINVDQAMDYDEKTRARTPSRDKVTDSLVWTVSCIDSDPEARAKEVRVKLLAPHMPVLPPEIVPGSGLRPVMFSGMTVTPYIDDNGRGRARLAFSFRATDMREPASGELGKATAGSATQTGRSGGQAPGSGQAGDRAA